MFDRLRYKQKTIALVVSVVVLLYAGFQISVVPTINLSERISKKETIVLQSKTAPAQTLQLKKQLKVLEKSVGNATTEFSVFQEQLLQGIIPFVNKNKLVLSEIQEPHYGKVNGYEIQTAIVKVRGGFKELSFLVDHIQKKSVGRVSSVSYDLEKDNKTQKMYLQATLFIQNFKAL